MEDFDDANDSSNESTASDSDISATSASTSDRQICHKPSKLNNRIESDKTREDYDFSVGNSIFKRSYLEKLLNSQDSKDKVMLNLIVSKIMKHDHKDAFQYIVEHGYKLDIMNNQNQTALHLAIYNNSVDIINWAESFLLTKYVNSDNCTDSNGLSYLHFACMIGKKKAVKKFLGEKYDVNAQWLHDTPDDRNGFTPLHFAVANHKVETVKLLLKRGASANLTDSSGRSPLHQACFIPKKFLNFEDAALPNHPEWNSELKIIKLLVENGTDLNLKDKLGNTPLLTVFKRDGYNREIYPEYDHGVTPKETSIKHLQERQKEKFDFLLEQGSDITAINNNNENILHRIIGDLMPLRLPVVCSDISFNDEFHAGLVEQVLSSEYEIDINLKNNQEETPLQQALQFISIEIFKVLLNHKADLSSITFHHQDEDFFFYPRVPPNLKAVRNLLGILVLLADNGFKLTLKDNITILKFLTHSYDNCECKDVYNYCVLKSNVNHMMNYGTPMHTQNVLESIRRTCQKTAREYLLREIVLVEMYKFLKLSKLAKMTYSKFFYDLTKKTYSSKYFLKQAKNEIALMKCMRLNQVDQSTVYHLLIHDHITIYPSAKKTNVDVLSKKLKHYGELLRGRIALSLITNYLLKSTYDCLRALVSPYLSDTCCENIIAELNWKEIINLCFAFAPEDFSEFDEIM